MIIWSSRSRIVCYHEIKLVQLLVKMVLEHCPSLGYFHSIGVTCRKQVKGGRYNQEKGMKIRNGMIRESLRRMRFGNLNTFKSD